MEEVLRLNCPLLGGERQLLPSSKLKKNTHIYLPSVYFTPRVETFSTVARKLGVDRQQLLALNSEAYSTVKRPVRGETKLKTGSKVLIPFDLSPKPVVQADDVAGDAQASSAQLPFTCDLCSRHFTGGRRWQCLVCDEFDMCLECHSAGAAAFTASDKHTPYAAGHKADHPLQCVGSPDAAESAPTAELATATEPAVTGDNASTKTGEDASTKAGKEPLARSDESVPAAGSPGALDDATPMQTAVPEAACPAAQSDLVRPPRRCDADGSWQSATDECDARRSKRERRPFSDDWIDPWRELERAPASERAQASLGSEAGAAGAVCAAEVAGTAGASRAAPVCADLDGAEAASPALEAPVRAAVDGSDESDFAVDAAGDDAAAEAGDADATQQPWQFDPPEGPETEEVPAEVPELSPLGGEMAAAWELETVDEKARPEGGSGATPDEPGSEAVLAVGTSEGNGAQQQQQEEQGHGQGQDHEEQELDRLLRQVEAAAAQTRELEVVSRAGQAPESEGPAEAEAAAVLPAVAPTAASPKVLPTGSSIARQLAAPSTVPPASNAAPLTAPRQQAPVQLQVVGGTAEQVAQLTSLLSPTGLGGCFLAGSSFASGCTHVVVYQPKRTEKLLAAIAAGRWVVNPT